MKLYMGTRHSVGKPDAWLVNVFPTEDCEISEIYLLPLRLKLREHAAGFNWGNHSSGASQLALAILADSIGPGWALENSLIFKTDVIATLPNNWKLNEIDIRKWLIRQTTRSK